MFSSSSYMRRGNGKPHPSQSFYGPLAFSIFVVILAAFSCSAPKQPSPEPDRPAPLANEVDRPAAPAGPMNLVLIVADTFRADRVTMQRDGKPLMPNLAAFASQSWYYTNCRCQATWTKPSMASLFTSLYPEVHRVLFGIEDKMPGVDTARSDVMPEAFETIAEYLKAHRYATAGVQSNSHVTAYFGFEQGFESYTLKRHPEFHADAITDTAIEQLGKLSPPFFLYVHYMDTHGPYDMPGDLPGRPTPPADLPAQDKDLLEHWNDGYLDRVLYEVGLTPKRTYGNFSKVGEQYVREKYDASAAYLDGEVARFLARLSKQFPNSLIVFTADHGEELFEHGSVGHGKTVFEEVTRVPLIIKTPNSAASAINAPVELIDVLPTCAALLGLPAKPEWQGKVVAATGPSLSADRPVFSSAQMSMTGSNRDLEAVIRNERKLIIDKKTSGQTIYDLSLDPAELGPIHESFSPRDLTEALDAFHAANTVHLMRQVPVETTELTDEQRERLRAIGYLQDK